MTCSWGGLGPAPAANLPTVASFFSLPHRLLQLQSILSLREHTQLNLLPTLTCKHVQYYIFSSLSWCHSSHHCCLSSTCVLQFDGVVWVSVSFLLSFHHRLLFILIPGEFPVSMLHSTASTLLAPPTALTGTHCTGLHPALTLPSARTKSCLSVADIFLFRCRVSCSRQRMFLHQRSLA